MSLSENIKGLANDIVQLNELKTEALKQTLPTKEQTLQMLDDAHKQEKPSHLSDEQWNKWLETGELLHAKAMELPGSTKSTYSY
jgi:hypothetical protein